METKKRSNAILIDDKTYEKQHPSRHARPADTFIANGQSFNTMSNENNVSDDEEYFLLYPGLIESSDGVYDLINKNSGSVPLKIDKATNNEEYSQGMKDTAYQAYTFAQNEGVPV
jgi:hypothetical protein